MTTVAERFAGIVMVLAQPSAVAAALVLERGGVVHAVVRVDPRVPGSTVAADAGD
jgi:hypothetical protein